MCPCACGPGDTEVSHSPGVELAAWDSGENPPQARAAALGICTDVGNSLTFQTFFPSGRGEFSGPFALTRLYKLLER